jgi:Gpi18-like mannosyltransferase
MRFKTQKLLIFLIFTRIVLLVLPWLLITLLYPENQPQNLINFTLNAWNRWDATHYLYLAQNWYTNTGDAANFIVFFPLYPLIIKVFLFTFNPVVIGIITSSTFFILGSYVFYELIKIDYPEKIARWATIALALFPTSYFFNAPYTEALFLLIFSTSLYAARKNSWVLAGLLAALGCITRPFGILLLPTILVEWLVNKNRNWKQIPVIIFPSIITVFFYLYLNQLIYGNMFEFQNILANHWQKHFMSPLASIMDTWRIAFYGGLNSFGIMVGWAEAITITTSWILIPIAFKYLRKSWAVYYTLSIILFSSTSFILSSPRYLLSVPPFFVLIAIAEKNTFFRLSWRFISIALLLSFAILFARGQWAF